MQLLVRGAQARYVDACLEVVCYEPARAGGAAGGEAGGGGPDGGDGAAKRKRKGKEPAAPGGGTAGGDGVGPSAPHSGSGGGATPPTGYFVILDAVPEVRYDSCAKLMAALEASPAKAGVVVLLFGEMTGWLRLRLTGTKLRGVFLNGRRAVLRGVVLDPKDKTPRHTLAVGAHNVSVSEVQICTPLNVDGCEQASAVFLKAGCSDFSMDDVYIAGDASEAVLAMVNEELTNHGHSGVWMNRGVRNASFRRVRMVDLSGDGVEMHYNASAQFDDVMITQVRGNGAWLNASAACELNEVHATACGGNGFYVDALDVCRLHNCTSRDSGEAALVVDVPLQTLKDVAGAALTPALLRDGHCARGFRGSRSGTYGTLLCRGAAVDLTDAVFEDSCWNALRTEYSARLPVGATARITLAGAQLLRNGLSPSEDKAEAEHAAIAVERDPVTKVAHGFGLLDLGGLKIEGNGHDGIVMVDGKVKLGSG